MLIIYIYTIHKNLHIIDSEKTSYTKFLEYLYNNKEIKKNSSFEILACGNKNPIKKLLGWESIIFEFKENCIANISTTNYEFTAFIITAVQPKENETVENLILFYKDTLHDLKIKKINKKYKINNDEYIEYLFSEFYYISPHKPNDWYLL